MSPREREPRAPGAADRQDGDLTPPEAERIDALIRALPRIDPSPGFEAGFWARLARAETHAPRSHRIPWWSRWRIPVETLAAATALLIFAVWITPRDSALADSDWSLVADGERFEILLGGDLELLASLDVVEAWDGSEGG